MKIAIYTPTFLPKCSGAEIFHHNLAGRLAARGHGVSVIAPRGAVRALGERGCRLGYGLEPYPSKLWSWLARCQPVGLALNRWMLGRFQSRGSFDVWHGVVTYPTGVSLIDWGRVPYLVRSVGDDILADPSRGVGMGRDAAVARILGRHLPRARLIVAQSESMRAAYEAMGISRDRLVVVPNAVDLERFAAGGRRGETRRGYGWGEGDFVFLSVGRNHPQKDYATLLAAMGRLGELVAGRRPFRLVAVGRGVRGLEAEVRARGLGDAVQLIEAGMDAGGGAGGFVMPPDEMVALYGASDAFVLSSRLEGFSSAQLEAMASGLPSVVTDGPGCADWIRDAGCAIVVPVGDASAMAGAMARLMDEGEMRARYAIAARRRAEEFGWERLVPLYERLYGALVGGASDFRGFE